LDLEIPLRTYRSPRELLEQIRQIIGGNQPSFHSSPLEEIVEALANGRHYSWVAIHLTAEDHASPRLLGAGGDAHPAQIKHPQSKSKILVSMRIAGREIGVLAVENERAFGSEDRVLLEGVADLLARFLAGPGKYLVLKARTAVPVARSAAGR